MESNGLVDSVLLACKQVQERLCISFVQFVLLHRHIMTRCDCMQTDCGSIPLRFLVTLGSTRIQDPTSHPWLQVLP